MAIKLFELDTSVRESAKQLGLAYNTVYHLYQGSEVITDSSHTDSNTDASTTGNGSLTV